MKGRFFLDIVVGKDTTILELLSSEDETLLIRVDEFFVLTRRILAFTLSIVSEESISR